MTRQAVQLGLLPRFELRHTSAGQSGQTLLPFVNAALLAGVLLFVAKFGSSSALAYGIAVSGTMVVTTGLAMLMLRYSRGWSWPLVALVAAPILLVESAFVAANMIKVPDSGYVPLALCALIGVAMWTRARGTRQLLRRSRAAAVPLDSFIARIERGTARQVPGTVVYLTSDPAATPPALLHKLKHNHVLHKQIIVVTVETVEAPRVDPADRARIERLNDRFFRVALRFGFMKIFERQPGARGMPQGPPVFREPPGDLLPRAAEAGRKFYGRVASLAGSTLHPDVAPRHRPSDFYRLPRDRVVELGSQMAV